MLINILTKGNFGMQYSATVDAINWYTNNTNFLHYRKIFLRNVYIFDNELYYQQDITAVIFLANM